MHPDLLRLIGHMTCFGNGLLADILNHNLHLQKELELLVQTVIQTMRSGRALNTWRSYYILHFIDWDFRFFIFNKLPGGADDASRWTTGWAQAVTSQCLRLENRDHIIYSWNCLGANSNGVSTLPSTMHSEWSFLFILPILSHTTKEESKYMWLSFVQKCRMQNKKMSSRLL